MASAVPSGSQLMTLDQHANQCETRMRQPFNMQNAVFRKGDAPSMMFYSSDASDARLCFLLLLLLSSFLVDSGPGGRILATVSVSGIVNAANVCFGAFGKSLVGKGKQPQPRCPRRDTHNIAPALQAGPTSCLAWP